MKTLYTIILSLGFHISFMAQIANRQTHENMADSIKTLYNTKKFSAIYEKLSLSFQSALSQKDFTTFLENNIYAGFGEIKEQEYLSDEKQYHSFLSHFNAGNLRLNLSIDKAGKINGFQFLPYKAPSKSVNDDIISDNKNRSPIDSVVNLVASKFIRNGDNCGLSIGISINGEHYYYNYGEIRRNSKILPSNETIYEIGSMSKTFCGLLLAQAVSEKKIDLEDDVRKYLPGKYPQLEDGKNFIRIKHLVTHSSGLPRIPSDLLTKKGFDSLNPYKHYTREDILAFLKDVQLETEPGTVFEYSNLGMAVLGIILERIYKLPFDQLVKEKICVPIQMTSTGVMLSPEQLSRFADGYNAAGQQTPHWDLEAFSAAGALRSTTSDMLKYLDYNAIEGDESTKLAHKVIYNNREKIAMSWFVKNAGGLDTEYWHNGATFGSGSFEAFLKEKKYAVVVLANSSTSVDFIGIAIIKHLLQ